MTGVDRKYLRNLRFAKKHNKVVPKGMKRMMKLALMAERAALMAKDKMDLKSKIIAVTGKGGKVPGKTAIPPKVGAPKATKRPATDAKKSAPPAKKAAVAKKSGKQDSKKACICKESCGGKEGNQKGRHCW